MEMSKTNNQKIKKSFEQLYGKKLSDAEVLEYKDKLVQLFSLFIEIDQKIRSKEVIENGR